MSFTKQKRGKLGEDTFGNWASLAGMEVTTPDEDLNGWDRFLEWHLDSEERAAPPFLAEEEGWEVKALVQIKTTTASPGSYQISLANWQSLIEYRGPSFLAVLEVSEREMDLDVEAVYLVHLWEEHITRFAKRMTERERGGKDEEELTLFHKATLTISYQDADRLSPPYPQAIRAALSDPVRHGPDRYVKEKIQLRQRAGYPGDKKHFKLRLTSSVPDEYGGDAPGHFADVLLGKAELSNPKLDFGDVRFGYHSEMKRLPEGTELRVRAPKNHIRLRFESNRGLGRRERTNGYVQNATIGSAADLRSVGGKLRYTFPRVEEPPGPLAEITLLMVEEGVRFNFSFNLPGDTRLPLSSMHKVLSISWS